MTTTFETAKVGDRVWCINAGWGEIRGIDGLDAYPIAVYFLNDEFKTYTAGGLHDEDDITQSLFWGEVKLEAPQKPLLDLEVDTKVVVWNDPKQKHNRHFSHFSNGRINTFDMGCTSFTSPNPASVTDWPHWELAE